jgi:hypothetical protein
MRSSTSGWGSGDKRSLSEYIKLLQDRINPHTLELLENALRLVRALGNSEEGYRVEVAA